MASDARRGYRSGKTFEVGAYSWIRGGAIIEDGALVERDAGIDRSEVTTALNDGLLRVLEAAVRGANRGGRDRLTVSHDFEYPSDTECISLQPSATMPEGVPTISPALARPLLDVIAVHDRRVAYTMPEVTCVSIDHFDTTMGARWAFQADRFFFSDLYGTRGRGAARRLRLVYVPAPEPIDPDNDQPRTDIPLELHAAVELWAAKNILQKTGADRAREVTAIYEAELAEALANFRPAINAARYIKSTRQIRR